MLLSLLLWSRWRDRKAEEGARPVASAGAIAQEGAGEPGAIAAPKGSAAAPAANTPTSSTGDRDWRAAFDRLAYAQRWTSAAQPPELLAFREWTERFLAVASPEARASLETEGVALARARRAVMRGLIERDPRRALAMTVPAAIREALPPAVVNELEAHVAGTGELGVYLTEPMDPLSRAAVANTPAGESPQRDAIHRIVSLDGVNYIAHVYGRRRASQTKENASLHGIAIDGHLALHESPLRLLEPGEHPARAVEAIDPVSNETISAFDQAARNSAATSNQPSVVELHGKLWALKTAGDLATLERFVREQEILPGPRVPEFEPVLIGQPRIAEAQATSWTTGTKRVLVVRVDFSDVPGEPVHPVTHAAITQALAQSIVQSDVRPFYEEASFGKATLSVTASSSVYRMPQTASSYAFNDNSTKLHEDAMAAASADYTLTNFDSVIVVFSYIGPSRVAGSKFTFGGRGSLGGSRILINGFYEFTVVAHELGHNYGLMHANLWQVHDGNALSNNGTSTEYGDLFDIMGNESNTSDHRHHFSAAFKNRLGWIPDSAVTTVTTSGRYRVSRFDAQTAPLDQPLALNIFRDGSRSFWIAHRRAFTTNPSLSNGAYVQWGFYSNRQSQLLDLTSPGFDSQNPGLAINATLDDPQYGVSIKPVAQGGSAPSEYLDLDITVGRPLRNIVAHWGDVEATDVPPGLSDVVQIAAGDEHGIALKRDGSIVVWGEKDPEGPNRFGELAIPGGLTGNVASVAAGGDCSGVIKKDGTVLVWGLGDDGQTAVPAGLNNVTQLALGGDQALALKSDGTVVAWGNNERGQIAVPAGLSGVKAISAGRGLSLALLADGTVLHWGVNADKKPADLANVIAIAAGWGHALALKADGTVVAWGDNLSGECNVPAGLGDVKQIAAGDDHSVALKNDGTIVAWGDNTFEQVTIPRGLPHDIEAIAAGENHTMALVRGLNPPTVTSQPVSQTVGLFGSASFSVIVTSATPAIYQWQFRANSAAAWANLTDGASISGTATAQLKITSAVPAQAGDYRAVVTNTGGQTASMPATLFVTVPPIVIHSNPADQSVKPGDTASFSVSATAGVSTLQFQWQRRGTAFTWTDLVENETYHGTRTDTLSVVGVTRAMEGHQFRCVVGNGGYSAEASSNFATLWISVKPLVFSRSPGSADVPGNGAVKFSAIATGEGTVTYRWQRRAKGTTSWVDVADGSSFSGASTGVLKVTVAGFSSDGDEYRCLVIDTFNPELASQAVRLNIVPAAPALVCSPRAEAPVLGGSVVLNAPVPGVGPYTFQWRKDGRIIPGASGSSLTLINLKPGDAGFYDVVMTDATGTVTSEVSRLKFAPAVYASTVRPNPKFAPVFEKAGGTINTAVASSDGTIFIGGDFQVVGGRVGGSVVKLRADGSVDPDYLAPSFSSGKILCMALQPDQSLVVAGNFTQVGDHAQKGIARLLPNGRLDPTFKVPSGFDAGSGWNSSVYALALQSDGKILAGGAFQKFGGVERRSLARLNSDGTLDTAYAPRMDLLGITEIHGMALQRDDKLLLPGNTIRRLLPDGSLDPTFSVQTPTSYPYEFVAIQPDGRVVGTLLYSDEMKRFMPDGTEDTSFSPPQRSSQRITGLAMSGGKILVAKDAAESRPATIIRLDATGREDASFTPLTLSGGVDNIARANALVPAADGSLFAFGSFGTVSNSAHENMVHLYPSGQVDETYKVPARINGEIFAVAETTAGHWIVGGSFSFVDGEPRGNIALLDAEGALDGTFAHMAGFNGPVHSIERTVDGGWFVGGSFTSFNAEDRRSLARFGDDFALDTTFVPEHLTTASTSYDFDSLLPMGHGRLLVGGSFDFYTSPFRGGLVRFDGEGRIDAGFPGGSATMQGRLHFLGVGSGGKILAGGLFGIGGYYGQSIVSLQPDGALDESFRQDSELGIYDEEVLTVARDYDAGIIVGGRFFTFARQARNHIARLRENGTLDPDFPSGWGFDNRVTALLAQTDGGILVGGEFGHFDNQPSAHLVRLMPNGKIDSTFTVRGLAFCSETKVHALNYRSDGALLVGGSSFNFTDFQVSALVLLEPPGPPPVVSRNPQSVTVDAGGAFRLEVEATSATPLAYQWQIDGVDVPHATAATLVVPSAQAFLSGDYSVIVRNLDGSARSAVVPVVVREPTSDTDSRVLNLSTRGLALTGGDVLIPGFVVSGSADKRLLMRVVGPTLSKFNVADPLPNPRLTLKRLVNGAYQDFAANDDWSTNANASELASTSASLFAFSLPANSADAALLLDVPPGQYTIIGDDANGSTGVAIVELYDADETNPSAPPLANRSRLSNISNRGFVGTGGNIMIPGFVVSSEGPKTLLIRAVGPGLTRFGVNGVLADPQLTIYFRPLTGGDDTAILTQDNWSDNPDAARTASVAAQVSAFSLTAGSKDAAFVVTLQPGIYTVQASGVNNTTGVGLVEVYEVP